MSDWKEKYFASLEDLEEREKQWAETELLLKRCVSRMTLAVEGYGEKADELLERLRNSIRGERNYDRIKNMVDAIIELTAKFNKKKSSQLTAKNVMLVLLKKLPWPKEHQKAQRKLLKKVEDSKDSTQLATHVEPLMKLFSIVLSSAGNSKEGASSKKSMLGGLFGGGDKKQTADTPDANEDTPKSISIEQPQTSIEDKQSTDALMQTVILELLGQLNMPVAIAGEVDRLRSKVERISNKDELQLLVKDLAGLMSGAVELAPMDNDDIEGKDIERFSISEILIRLLERLDLPDEMHAKSDALKRKWEKGLSENEIIPAIEDIAELVVEIRLRIEREKNEFQEFLRVVTDRLQDLDAHIQDDVKLHEKIFSDSSQFSDDVDGQVNSIRENVDNAVELQALKSSISEQLLVMEKHVDNYRAKEASHKNEMQQRVELLAGKVTQLETESSDLREQILEEKELAMRDALTKIPNRLALDDRLNTEYSRWKRYKSPLVLVVWDVDDFKKINDTYGHNAGDKVLVTIATLLNDQIRETDFMARFGGEEFVLLLPETNLENAVPVIEKLRESVADCQFHHGDAAVTITVSAGVTMFKQGDTIESAFERADKFLYKAKSSGKNCSKSDLDA